MTRANTDHFVIDGSNLATEGRTEPSLAQLNEAIAAFKGENPGAVVTVVVDASFEHRIDASERDAFARAEAANEVVSPPAGAVGRGDGFLLQIANRTGATVVSNDSFQEFHAEYEWLFEPGRLIGGKPVPGVGWIFSLRRPVRGIVSRKVVQQAKRNTKAAEQVREAIAEATADAMVPDSAAKKARRRRRGRRAEGGPPPEAVNDPAPFLQFVIDHRLGTEVSGTVDAFASHGAFVLVDGVRCYLPLSAMGSPPPNSARSVLERGEARTFVVQAVDAPRRGIELALPGYASVAGVPTDETVEAEMRSKPKAKEPARATSTAKTAKARAKTAKAPAKTAKTAKAPASSAIAPAKRPAKRSPAKKSPAKTAKSPAKTAKAPATKAAARPPAKSATKTAATRATAAKTPTAKTPTAKTPKRTPAKQPAKRTTKASAKGAVGNPAASAQKVSTAKKRSSR